MSDTTTLIERLATEADQCRNDGANDIAKLLDEAVTELQTLGVQAYAGQAGQMRLAAELEASRAAPVAPATEPECVTCTRCGHENWIQDGKAQAQVKRPAAPVAPAPVDLTAHDEDRINTVLERNYCNECAAPVAPAMTLLEQYDLEQSPEYRKGYEAGRHKGYKVGHQHGMAAARMAAPVAPAVPPGGVWVSVEFVRAFLNLAHNYSLTAEAPDHYRGIEADAFSEAYARCGRDLARVKDLGAFAPVAPALVPLTDEQIGRMRLDFCDHFVLSLGACKAVVKAVEHAHGIKP